MSEQQRIFATVALCLGILIVWQFLVVKPEAEEKLQPTATVNNNTATTPPVAEQQPLTDVKPSEETTPGKEATPFAVAESRKTLDTPLFSVELSNYGASLTKLELKGYDEKSEGEGPKKPVSLVTAERGGVARQAWLELELDGKPGPALVWDEAVETPTLVGRTAEGLEVRVTTTARGDVYALDYDLAVTNRGPSALKVGAKVTLSLRPLVKQKSSFFTPPADMMNGLCAQGSKVERKVAESLVEDGAFTQAGASDWAGLDRQYFVVALVPRENEAASCKMVAEQVKHQDGEADYAMHVDFSFASLSVAPGQEWKKTYTVYLGPKRNDSLLAVSPALGEVIDYTIWGIPLGFLARPMVFLLNTFHGWTASWGLAIMMLTLIVKGLLFPITYKSSLSMRKMQLLKPELDKIKKQFEGNKERQQLEQMKLFKDKGVNPLGGCIPMLLQMPVWLALYRTLWSAVDLYQQSFLWIPDLTAKEPFPFMAIALGALTFLQQKLQPTTMDSAQAKMMLYMMPAMMLLFMIALPSGLVLYILFNSVLTIFQQLAINRAKVAM